MFTFVIATIAFIIGVEIGLFLSAIRVPRCTCDDPRCGGGCIDWSNAS